MLLTRLRLLTNMAWLSVQPQSKHIGNASIRPIIPVIKALVSRTSHVSISTVQHTGNASIRVGLHYQFSGMPGLPNFPEKMAYVIHTAYECSLGGSSIICDQVSSGS